MVDRPAPGPARAPGPAAAPAPPWLPLALVGAGIVLSALGGYLVSFQVGGYVLALVLASCAVARLLLPVAAVGALAVRSRGVDAVTTAVLALAVGVLAAIAPHGP